MDTANNHSLTTSQQRPQDSKTSSAKLEYGDFVKLMLYLWAAIGRTKEPDDITLAAWYDNLSDLTREQVQTGMRRFIRERSVEFVNVQLIRELSGAQVASDEASVSAWNAVLLAIKQVGGYQTPRWQGRNDAARITQAIAHLGGWVRLCDTESDELHKWTRQAFQKAYNAIPPTAEQARLTNLIEQENARMGFVEAAERIRLENEQAAQQRIEVIHVF